MKIAFVASGTPKYDDFPQPSAGTSSQIWAIARELERRGVEVTIYRGTYDNTARQKRYRGIEVVSVPTPRLDAALNGMFTKLLFSWRVRKRLESASFDVVVVRERFAASFVTRTSIPSVYTVDSPDAYQFFRSFAINKHVANHVLYPYKNLVEVNALRNSDRVTTISEAMRDYLSEKGYDHVDFLGICVDPGDIPKEVDKRDDIVLFAGRQVELKRAEWALKAFRCAESRSFELHFAGDGPKHEHLRDLAIDYGIQDRVVFHGWMDRPDLLRLMSRASILVHPSKFEMGGNVVLEAMTAGCAVVASRTMGPETLIEHGESGYLFDVNDRSELTRHLDNLMNNPEIRTSLGESARDRARSEFNVSNVASRLLETCETVSKTGEE